MPDQSKKRERKRIDQKKKAAGLAQTGKAEYGDRP